MDLVINGAGVESYIVEALPDLAIQDIVKIETAIKDFKYSSAAKMVIDILESPSKIDPLQKQVDFIALKRFTKCITEIGWKSISSFGDSTEKVLSVALQFNIFGGNKSEDPIFRSHFYNHASTCARFMSQIKSEEPRNAVLFQYIELAYLLKSLNISRKYEKISYVVNQYSILIDLLLSFSNPSFMEDSVVVEILKSTYLYSWGEKIPCFLFVNALNFFSEKQSDKKEKKDDTKKVFIRICKVSHKIAEFCRSKYDEYTSMYLNEDLDLEDESLQWFKLSVKYHLAAIAINSFFSSYSQKNVVSTLKTSLTNHLEVLGINANEMFSEKIWADQNLLRFVNQELPWITQRIEAIINYAGSSFAVATEIFESYKTYIEEIRELVMVGTRNYNQLAKKKNIRKAKKKKKK